MSVKQDLLVELKVVGAFAIVGIGVFCIKRLLVLKVIVALYHASLDADLKDGFLREGVRVVCPKRFDGDVGWGVIFSNSGALVDVPVGPK